MVLPKWLFHIMNTTPMKYRIKFLRELKFELMFHGVEPLTREDVVLQTSFRESLNVDLKILEIFFHCLFGIKEGESIKQVVHSDIIIGFEFEELPENEEERNDVLMNLFPNLLGITISSARGVIYSRTKGDPINEYVLPIINPTKIMEERFQKKSFLKV